MIHDELTDFFMSVEDAKSRHLRCEEKAAELLARCENITSQWSPAPGGSGDLHKDATKIAYAQKTAEADWWKQEWARREAEVEAFLNLIPSRVFRLLLQFKYVDLNTWPQVTERLQEHNIFYVQRHVERLHGDALEEARAIWRAEQLKKENE